MPEPNFGLIAIAAGAVHAVAVTVYDDGTQVPETACSWGFIRAMYR